MIGNKFIENNTIEKTISVFGYLFSNIYTKKRNKRVKVPISYSAFQTISSDYSTQGILKRLPKMGFECTGLSYDMERKINPASKIVGSKVEGKPANKILYAPAPYNFSFTLYIQTVNLTMMSQILDQILPFFNPYITLEVQDHEEIDIVNNLQVVLENVSWEDNFEEIFESRRIVLTTLEFLVKAYFYVDVRDLNYITKSIIKFAHTDNPTGSLDVVYVNEKETHTSNKTVASQQQDKEKKDLTVISKVINMKDVKEFKNYIKKEEDTEE